jgi:hypothetical protein
MIRRTTAQQTAVDHLTAALDRGQVTCMQALTAIDTYRHTHAYDGLADVLTDAVRTWHAAETARMQRIAARVDGRAWR